jgi:hypothetical protein
MNEKLIHNSLFFNRGNKNGKNYSKHFRVFLSSLQLVHGDEGAKRALAGELHKVCPQTRIIIPDK